MTDRELDFAVAEHILGWKPHLTTKDELVYTHEPSRTWSVTGDHVPRSSTDPRRAIAVIDAMDERGWNCLIENVHKTDEPRWSAHFLRSGIPSMTAHAETMPKAVCLAALRAHEHDKSD